MTDQAAETPITLNYKSMQAKRQRPLPQDEAVEMLAEQSRAYFMGLIGRDR